MDFQNIVDLLNAPTCIMSVEKKSDGKYGDIRIVCGNKKYTDIISMRENPDAPDDSDNKMYSFVPNQLYTAYFPKSISYEDVCYRAAVLKKEVHTYAHIPNVDVWFDIYAMPLEYEDGDICYCTYSTILNLDADALLDTFNTSRTSNDVLKTCIKLHKARNLKEAMDNVIAEIRQICNAEGCTVLLMNEDYSILATNFAPNSTLKRVTEFEGYYDIANSWKDMLSGERDCIVVRNEEEMENVRKVNNPWYQTLVEAGVKSVVLFPLRQGEELLGFIWAVNFDTENSQRIKETLELTTFFLSSHIAHYKVIERIKHMTYTNSLTGLPNRFALMEYMSKLIRHRERFAAVSIDLNDFKYVNNTLGFDAGNKVLLEVAERWKRISDKVPDRFTDKVTKIDIGKSNDNGDKNSATNLRKFLTCVGGDEFFVIIRGYEDENELRSIISEYNKALSDVMMIDGCDIYISASYGYVEYPDDSDSIDALISHANAAMNEVKKSGNSEHILKYTPDLLRDEHIHEIEKMIRNALENDTLYFNMQPQYDMNHKLRGFESLARMKDCDGNVISPAEFIPVAEKFGLIDILDKTVARKSIMFFGELLRKTGADLILSLNVSVRHLMKSDFIQEIQQLLNDSGIPGNHLEIEITESIMIDSVDKALRCIDELKNMGVHIAIDDFGTGYSSLSYLNRFPANLLKIDKSFIDEMNTTESSRQYVAAIISMGHIMGFDVISEGVEEPEQIETLKKIGCDYIQGFVWGRPLPAEEVEKLVLNSKVDS